MNLVKSKISFLCLFVFIISFFFLNKIVFAQEEFGLPVMPPGGAPPLDIGLPPEMPALPPISEVPLAMPSVPVEPFPGMPIIPGEPPVPGVPAIPGMPMPLVAPFPGVAPVGVPVPPPVVVPAVPVTETQRPLISIPDKPVHLSETSRPLVSQSNAPGVEGRIDEVKSIVDQISNILMQIRSSRNTILGKFRDTDQKLDSLYQTLGFQRGQIAGKQERTIRQPRSMRQQ